MLSFVIAPSGYGKTYRLINEINRILDARENKNIYVIVPEQETVKMEAELIENCGNRINKSVEVINFSRLANRVFREAGGMTYTYIDSAGKDLVAAVILEKMKNACPIFAKSLDDTGYIQLLRSEMDTLRNRGFHASDIEKAREKLIHEDRGGQSLDLKLSDFAAIFAAYEQFLKDNVSDTSDDVARLAKTLEGYDFFEDAYVFIDGFYDYTAPQYSVIESIMKSCHSMTLTFSLFRNDPEKVFRRTREAFDRIREIAEKNGIEYEIIELSENHRTKNKALQTLADSIMSGDIKNTNEVCGVTLTEAATQYHECVYAAREITKLVKNGTPFSEIAVCAANMASYASMLENVLDSYDISHLTCTEKNATQMPIISFVISALEAINSGFYSEHMRSYLKSPYVPLDEDEAYLLDNYVGLWSIGKKNWLSEDNWIMNPRGYIDGATEADKKELELVNRARRKVFPPLQRLAEGFSERSTVKKKAESLVIFFEELELCQKVELYNAQLGQDLEIEEYDDEISAWNLLLDSLDMLVETAGGLKMGRDRFIKYMRLILSDMSFGKIPSSLDEVELGDVEFVRNKNIKHMFFLGFNEGLFPNAERASSVFTERERKWLVDNGVKLEETDEEKFSDQTFQFLLSVLRPSDSIHFVYHTASDNSKTQSLPSYFYTYLKDVLGIEAEHFDISTAPPVSISELREQVLSSEDDLSHLFNTDAEKSFFNSVKALAEFADRSVAPFHIDTNKPIISGDCTMSQSRLERYQKCRFSYFVEYMLNARVRKKAEFSRAEIGSYVHKILEIVLKELLEVKGDITAADEELVEKTARSSAEEYLLKVAPNIAEESPKYKYLTDNICSFVLMVIKNIQKEFSVSMFKPRYFEESISGKTAENKYEIALNDGGILRFNGTVDRVDSFVDENGIEYIRVVDYKTKSGGKAFALEDVLNGLNTQMLIYLYAFTGSPSEHPRAEAGIMYMPASAVKLSATDDVVDDAVLQTTLDGKFKRSGMYIDDKRIIDAMETGEKKQFMDVKFDTKSDTYVGGTSATLATLEEFGVIRRYIDRMFCDVIDNIKCGNIEANPIEDDSAGGSVCSWCKYHPICRYEGEIRQKKTSKTPLITMREELGEL